jgi:alanyl-tRNA synthetase
VIDKMNDLCKVKVDEELFLKYSQLAGTMNAEDFGSLSAQRSIIAKRLGVDAGAMEKQFAPREAMYAVADHARTLLFAIADGMLPSNSGGGYNLRILLRRAMNFINYYRFPLTLAEVVNWHIDYLQKMYPELEEHREDVAEVLGVELSRYASSAERVAKIVSSVSSSSQDLSTEDLMQLYDSDGVTPEQLIEAGAKVALPEDFYEKVQARHLTKKTENERPKYDISGMPPTELLYYGDEYQFNFEAKVLEVFENKQVVLDRTLFYPRGGGQEPDKGTMGACRVVDVEKYGEVVLHRIDGEAPKKGSQVSCCVDSDRRLKIMKIHTATHLINGSSRQILGPWVWQHSAFKEETYGRLDITHFAHLTQEEIYKIENLANEMVRRNLEVKATFMPRKTAEEKYGFRLYQGGVVPTKLLRVVNIGDWDIEACGGTHSRTTGEVGFIKITKVERVQDGIERIEFTAGEPAMEYVHKTDAELEDLSAILGTQRENLPRVVSSLVQELDAARAREKALGQTLVELSTSQVVSSARPVGSVKLYVAKQPQFGEDQIIAQGEKSVSAEPSLIYVSVFSLGKSARVVCFVGSKAKEAGYSANDIVRKLAPILGGSGGGSPTFAQGGGPRTSEVDEAAKSVERIISPTKA